MQKNAIIAEICRKLCYNQINVILEGEKMKRILPVLCSLILIISFAFSAFSAEIDGIDDGAEWDNAFVLKLLDGESNCDVNFGLFKAKFDNKNSAVFFSFMFIDPNLEQGNTNAGISLIIEDSEPFVLTMSSTPNEYDIDKYSFNGAMTVDENNGATCEVRIGLKYGLKDKIEGSVRFIDSAGAPSNFYDFSIENDGYVNTTQYYYNENNYTVKTTTEKNKTTTEKMTTKNETTENKTENEIDLDFIFDLFTETSTKRVTTTKVVKTTEKTNVQTKNYEKKNSVTLVTESLTESEATAIAVFENIQTLEITESIENNNKRVSLSDGSRYKMITGVVCGLILLIIAALGTFKFKNNKEENDPKQ